VNYLRHLGFIFSKHLLDNTHIHFEISLTQRKSTALLLLSWGQEFSFSCLLYHCFQLSLVYCQTVVAHIHSEINLPQRKSTAQLRSRTFLFLFAGPLFSICLCLLSDCGEVKWTQPLLQKLPCYFNATGPCAEFVFKFLTIYTLLLWSESELVDALCASLLHLSLPKCQKLWASWFWLGYFLCNFACSYLFFFQLFILVCFSFFFFLQFFGWNKSYWISLN